MLYITIKPSTAGVMQKIRQELVRIGYKDEKEMNDKVLSDCELPIIVIYDYVDFLVRPNNEITDSVYEVTESNFYEILKQLNNVYNLPTHN